MKNESDQLETLSEIRSLMERSTRFISLNGFAGVFAGVFALIGAFVAYRHLNLSISESRDLDYTVNLRGERDWSFYLFFFTDALLVLIASISVALFLAYRKARKKGLKFWDNSAKRVLFNMLVPLTSGGVFCLIMVQHGYVGLVAPATLLFYGMALVNAGKYTFNDIRNLGLIEIFLGLLAAVYLGYGLFFWALGFGIMHIVYGIIMYYKYEK